MFMDKIYNYRMDFVKVKEINTRIILSSKSRPKKSGLSLEEASQSRLSSKFGVIGQTIDSESLLS